MNVHFLSVWCACICIAQWALANPTQPAKVSPKKEQVKLAPDSNPLLQVVTTLPVLQKLVEAIGGNRVVAKPLATASSDPHFIKAVPSLKQELAKADLFVEIGLGLELWAEQVVKSSLNPKIQPGAPGFLAVSQGVALLETPQSLDRGQGDVHPFGNPHIWLSPSRVLPIAKVIAEKLAGLDPGHKEAYMNRLSSFSRTLAEHFFGPSVVQKFGDADVLWRSHRAKRLQSLLGSRHLSPGGWLSLAQGMKAPFITYHSELSYLADDFSLTVFAHVEEKPGIPPSRKHLDQLEQRALKAEVRPIVAASYYMGHRSMLNAIAGKIHGSVTFIDVDCRPSESYVAFIERVLQSLKEATSVPKASVKSVP